MYKTLQFSFLGACSQKDVWLKSLILITIFLWLSLIPVYPVLPLPLTFLSPSPHLSFILSVPLLFPACHLVHQLCTASFVFWPTANMYFHHTPVQNQNHLSSSLLCCRVSPKRGQSSWLTVRPVSQQPWTVPFPPVFPPLPPSNPQGEPWPEGARGWPPHGKHTCVFSKC